MDVHRLLHTLRHKPITKHASFRGNVKMYSLQSWEESEQNANDDDEQYFIRKRELAQEAG